MLKPVPEFLFNSKKEKNTSRVKSRGGHSSQWSLSSHSDQVVSHGPVRGQSAVSHSQHGSRFQPIPYRIFSHYLSTIYLLIYFYLSCFFFHREKEEYQCFILIWLLEEEKQRAIPKYTVQATKIFTPHPTHTKPLLLSISTSQPTTSHPTHQTLNSPQTSQIQPLNEIAPNSSKEPQIILKYSSK